MNTKQRELFVFGLAIGLAAGLVLGIGLRALWQIRDAQRMMEVGR